MSGLRERRRQETLVQIRTAALELFRRKGYHAVTTREVAELAEVGTGTLFLYARDKDELVLLAYDEVVAAGIDALLAFRPTSGGLLAQLLHVYGGIIEMFAADADNLGAYLRALQSIKHAGGHFQRAADRHERLVSAVATVIAEAQQAGAVESTIDPTLASRNFHALFSAALARSMRTGEVAPALAALEASFALQMRALTRTDPGGTP
jgi:AcrR family transcriptional regulator